MRLTASRRSSSARCPYVPVVVVTDARRRMRCTRCASRTGESCSATPLPSQPCSTACSTTARSSSAARAAGAPAWRPTCTSRARRGNQASRLGHSVWPVLRCPPLAGFVTSPEDRGEDDEPRGRRTRVHRGDVHGARCIRPFTVTTIVTAAGCAIPPLRWGGSTRCCADTSSRFSIVMPRRHPRSRNAPDVRRPGAPVRCADSHVAGALLIIGIV